VEPIVLKPGEGRTIPGIEHMLIALAQAATPQIGEISARFDSELT